MRNRVSFLIGLSMVFILSFVIIILLGYAQTDSPDFSWSQKLITELFPNSKITWSKELEGEMVNFRATSGALAIMIGNADKRRIKFINFKDTTEWSIDCSYNSCRYYDVVGKEESVLLIKGVEPGGIFTSFYCDDGQHAFTLNLDSWIYPSPNLEYFHTKAESEPFEVYDHKGRFMWKRKRLSGSVWFAQALSDQEIVYEDHSGCYLLEAFTGDEIWKISWIKYWPLVGGFINMSSASDGKHFLLYDDDGIISIDHEGQVLWRKEVSLGILSGSLTEDGRFVALYLGKSGKSSIRKMEFLDNFNSGEVLWSRSFESQFDECYSDIQGLKTKGNKLSIVPGFVSYNVGGGIKPKMQTFCFEFNPENGELLNQYTIDGVCETFRTDNGRIHYLLVHKEDKKEIFRFEEGINK